jgi:hypothetical protein
LTTTTSFPPRPSAHTVSRIIRLLQANIQNCEKDPGVIWRNERNPYPLYQKIAELETLLQRCIETEALHQRLSATLTQTCHEAIHALRPCRSSQ